MDQHDFRSEIIRKTTGMIRTFLDELANETSTYKSLHNLTEQVEHQYHGRFLIELIQNAHDAMNDNNVPGDQGRLEIMVDQDESPHGALYVANDGLPFTRSNFECLSQLGQSDKDPEKSIGNKGIGFRSVLEITDAPEIYSRKLPESKAFDGYCFLFSPGVTKLFEEPIMALLNGNDKPLSPLDNRTPLVEWSQEKLRNFRALYCHKGTSWLANELKYLSPYLLPIPTTSDHFNQRIRNFQKTGFASIIRIPFKNDKAKRLAIEMLDHLDENTILFLDRVKSLALTSGTKQRLVERKTRNLNDLHNGQEITLEVVEDGTERYIKKRYWLWTEEIGGDENPAERGEIIAAVADLPGRWPELTKAQVSLAVKIGDTPEEGRINIYLPTELLTGCWAHFSGPFYGDMSRTGVDFKKPFNEILFKRIGRKAIEIVIESLAGKALEEAGAILDILAPSTEEQGAGEAWFSVLKSICEEKGINLSEQKVLFSDKGWNSPKMISLIPEIKNSVVLTKENIRTNAEFQAIVQGLSNREDQIKELFKYIEIYPYPLKDDLANTLERIAQTLCDESDNKQWNGFWEESIELFGGDAEPLKGKKVLLGNDNALHACGSDCTVFFTPRQGADDDDIQGDGAVRDIPDSVRPFVSFLNESIKVYNEKDARVQTPVRKFLDSTLVQRFRVEDILRAVLVPKMPPLPVKLKSKKGALCRDILMWALRLVAGMPDRGQGRKSTLRWLRQLRVPCLGGWYLLEESSFGPGWTNTAGKYVLDYLSGAGTEESKDGLNRLLQPPQHRLWDGKGASYQDLLVSAGIVDGLRINNVLPDQWISRRFGSKYSYQLPTDPPPCTPELLWKEYVEVNSPKVKSRFSYSGMFDYEVQSVSVIPGLGLYPAFSDETRIALMNALFASLHQWEERWKTAEIKKVGGVMQTVEIESPLSFCLRNLPWIAIEKDGKTEWETPGRRWYVPKDSLAGRGWQFAHLRPLPGTLADRIDRNQHMAQVLSYLGMPKFDPEEKTSSTRLLDDLATALDTDLPDRNTFLNHVRIAWNTFSPEDDDPLPDILIVSNGPRTLHAVKPDSETPVYLPDSSASFISALGLFSLPVIEIETPDAKRLATHFKRYYGDAVRLASELTVWPLVEDRRWEIDAGDLLAEGDYAWLLPVSLTLFAFSGSKPQGPYTKRFASVAQMLRDARICWVRSLKAGLWKSEEIIATPSIPAMWLGQEKILVCDKNFSHQVSNLSEAIEAMVDRDDIELPLKHVLEKLERIEAPTHADICNALESLKISGSQFIAAYERWRGDISQIIRMMMPVVTLFDQNADIGRMSDMNTEEELVDFLAGQEISLVDPNKLLELVRSSDDYYMLGKRLYDLVGESAQLSKWNEALERIGEKPITNKNAHDEFLCHLQKIRVSLQATLAHILRREKELGVYKLLMQEINRVDISEEMATKLWEIGFRDAIGCVKNLLKDWHALPDEISAFLNGESPEDIQSRLTSMGINANVSPLTIQKQNHDLFLKVLDHFQKMAIAWCIRQNISPLSWEKTAEEVSSYYNGFFDHTSYLSIFDEKDLFSLLKELPRENIHVDFWKRIDTCDDLQSVMKSLSLSPEDLAKAEKNLESYKEMQRRQKRLVPVCGKDFDSIEDNLSSLWNLISSEIKETALPEVNLNKMTHLLPAERTGKKKPRGDRPANSPKPKGRTSKAMENLIGFAGEIHAYRMLSRAYGETVVHPSTWRSLYSQLVFPDNIPDDGAGCDFIIHHKGKRIHIEVKSSLEDDETFQLGSSEIELAIELVRKKKDEFLIMHVNKVLTNNPGVRLLPNPYDPKNQGLYSFEEAGMRVKYNLKS